MRLVTPTGQRALERPFSFIENNFLAGRTFQSWEDLNQQVPASEFATKSTPTYKKHLRAVPRELFAIEPLHLKPLLAWTPEVRTGFCISAWAGHGRLCLGELYSVTRFRSPGIGRRVEIRETRDRIAIELDPRHIVTHDRVLTPLSQRITLSEHRPPRGAGR